MSTSDDFPNSWADFSELMNERALSFIHFNWPDEEQVDHPGIQIFMKDGSNASEGFISDFKKVVRGDIVGLIHNCMDRPSWVSF